MPISTTYEDDTLDKASEELFVENTKVSNEVTKALIDILKEYKN